MVQSARLSSRGLRFSFKKHVFVVVFVSVCFCFGRKSVFLRERQKLHPGVATHPCYLLSEHTVSKFQNAKVSRCNFLGEVMQFALSAS